MSEIKSFDPLVTCPACKSRIFRSHTTCPRCGVNLVDGKANGRLRKRFMLLQGLADGSNPYDEYARTKKMDKAREQAKIANSKTSGKSNHAVAGMVRCRSCWHDNLPGPTVCGNCGASLPRSSTSGSKTRPKVCRCGFDNPPLARICLQCGGTIKLKCPVCGHRNNSDALQCAKCGEPFSY